MYTEENINAAIEAGIITQDAANALKTYVTQAKLAGQNSAQDEEHFQLVTGFNDIFVVIASLLLLMPLNLISGGNALGGLLAAAIAWGLAEFFVRKRRMALPAIVLLLSFVTNVFYATFDVCKLFISNPEFQHNISPSLYIVPAIVSAFAAWLHWRRFKVPITVAAGTAAIVVGLLAGVVTLTSKDLLAPAAILAGLAVFVFAMWWDAQDIRRQTRKSDVGFWLHLLAAPLIIHPVFDLIGVLQGKINLAQATVVLALYIAIGIVSLLIDRRALMVSALGYVVYVFSSLLSNAGHVEIGFAITAFTIGSALLLLSAFWHNCRIFLLQFLPTNLKAYLPNAKD